MYRLVGDQDGGQQPFGGGFAVGVAQKFDHALAVAVAGFFDFVEVGNVEREEGHL